MTECIALFAASTSGEPEPSMAQLRGLFVDLGMRMCAHC